MDVEKRKPSIRNFLIYQIGAPLLQQFEKLIPRYSRVGTTPFLDSSEFAWTQTLEKHWHIIYQELEQVLLYRESLPNFQDISPDQATVTSTDDRWKTYFLYGYGVRAEQNCQRCPETTRLIEQIPGMKTAFFQLCCRVSISLSIEVPIKAWCDACWDSKFLNPRAPVAFACTIRFGIGRKGKP